MSYEDNDFENPSTALVETKTNKPANREADIAKAIEEVRAPMVMARQFPRDQMAAEQRINTSCKRYSLARIAIYSYPKGKEKGTGKSVFVSGPSIRLLEVIAQNWGNIDFGFRYTRDEKGATVFCFAHDLESNTRQAREFYIEFKIKAYDKIKIITDPREQYELIANNAMRRVRECLRGVIPRDITDSAEAICRKTLELGASAEPFIDRVRRMVTKFAELGVSKDMLEKKLGHSLEDMVPAELVDFTGVYNAIKDGHANRAEFFELTNNERQKTVSNLNETLLGKKQEAANGEAEI